MTLNYLDLLREALPYVAAAADAEGVAGADHAARDLAQRVQKTIKGIPDKTAPPQLSPWRAFSDEVPLNSSRMIWWADGTNPARLVQARDFCKEDRGYWMYPIPPAEPVKSSVWFCPCGAPLEDSTAVCRKCFPEGIAPSSSSHARKVPS